MALTTVSTLPEGMRERSFAFVNSENGEVLKFGRGTDYHCSEYTFPTVGMEGDDYSVRGFHSNVIGNHQIESNFFEAEFGVINPGAAEKMEKIMGAWMRAAYLRPSYGSHMLYTVLGGRPRLIFGMPSNIAPKYHGFKTTYHEGVLRFKTLDPFFYSSHINRDKAIYPAAEKTEVRPIGAKLTMPTPLSFNLSGKVPDGTKIQVGPSADGPWRTMIEVFAFDGNFTLTNRPGRAVTQYAAAATPMVFVSGANYIKPITPALRDVKIWPADTHWRIVKPATTGEVAISVEWRDCYASA